MDCEWWGLIFRPWVLRKRAFGRLRLFCEQFGEQCSPQWCRVKEISRCWSMYRVFSNAPVTTCYPPMERHNHCSCAHLKELKELESYSQYISEWYILVHHMYNVHKTVPVSFWRLTNHPTLQREALKKMVFLGTFPKLGQSRPTAGKA